MNCPITLIRNAEVFAPEPLGQTDVLLAGNQIAALGPSLALQGDPVVELDAREYLLVPGFVDALTHPCGGGGEGGFGNRTPEISAREFIAGGITTPVGALGTDSVTRSLEVLFGSVMNLRASGLAAFMYTGSYRMPAPTLTGDIARDLVLLAPVIGVGEVAIADHRSSQPTRDELARLASEVALGGILSGKQGTVFVHVGDSVSGLNLIEEVLAETDLPRRIFMPTHVNRKVDLLNQAVVHATGGGFADITVATTPELVAAGDIEALDAFDHCLEAGAPAGQLTFSSDAGGSLPVFQDGVLTGLQAARPDVLLRLLQSVGTDDPARFRLILAALTDNPARALGLQHKGRLAVGHDADLLLLRRDDLSLQHVFCRGRALMHDGTVVPPALGATPR